MGGALTQRCICRTLQPSALLGAVPPLVALLRGKTLLAQEQADCQGKRMQLCLEMVNAVGCELTHDLQRFQTPFRSWSPETVINCCAALVEIRLSCAKFLGPRIHWFPVISNLFSWGVGCPNVWNIHIDHVIHIWYIYIYVRKYVYVYTIHIISLYSLLQKISVRIVTSNVCVFFSNP